MYSRLIIEMKKRKVTQKAISEALGIFDHTLRDKMNGKFDFKLSEAVTIRDKFFRDLPLDTLFKKD